MDDTTRKYLDLMYSKEKQEEASDKHAEMIKAQIDLNKANLEIFKAAEQLIEDREEREISRFEAVLGVINKSKLDAVEEQEKMGDVVKGFMEKIQSLTPEERSSFKTLFDQLKTG